MSAHTFRRPYTRRWVLGSLAAVATTAANAELLQLSAAGSWDVIVVGAGTAGIPAALFSARRGARVLLLEKGGQVGGTLWMSGGQMSAAGTRAQKAEGIVDSPADHLADIMRISGGTANEGIVRIAVENAAATVDWLQSSGLEIASGFPAYGTGHEPYTKKRVHQAPNKGLGILAVLRQQLEAAPASLRLLTGMDVAEPVIDRAGAVVGVIAKDSNGVRREFRAPVVVLASGGYMANSKLFLELNGVPKYQTAGWGLNTGAGIDIGRAAGGFVRGRENYLCNFGTIPNTLEIPSGAAANSIHHPETRQPWEIIVNSAGQRFMAEDAPSIHTRELALLSQADHRYWLVFDDEILRQSPTLLRMPAPGSRREWTREELLNAFGSLPTFQSASTLEELAAKAGIDSSGLVASVRAYNEGQAAGKDALGRKHLPRPIAKPPFYAIRHQGGTIISMAGLAVDERLRVIKPDGAPVRGLYAAGEMLGNCTLSGRAFCGGMMVTPALTFGRLLGESVPLGVSSRKQRG